MRFELRKNTMGFALDPATGHPGIPTKGLVRKKSPVAKDLRARTLWSILTDADRSSAQYVQRWKAGRGAE